MSAPAGTVYRWVDDPYITTDHFDDEADKAYVREHGAVECILYRPCSEHGINCPHAEILASLCGIVESQDPQERDDYRREVERQLAEEAGIVDQDAEPAKGGAA